MRSFQQKIDSRRAVYLNLAGSIESQLRDAYALRNEQGEATQASLGKKLNVDRSAIHRRLTGQANLTTETIADMVWALGHCIEVKIFDPASKPSNEFRIVPRDDVNIHARTVGLAASSVRTNTRAYTPQKMIPSEIVDVVEA